MIKRITWIVNFDGESNAYNKKKEWLGSLIYEQIGRHYHYFWYQQKDIRMSPGCLQEVRDKQKELLRERNNVQKKKRLS